MKKTLSVIALTLFCFVAKAQTKIIDSFLGVKLGSTRAQVIAGLTQKGAKLDKKNGDANTLIFDNIKIASRSPEYLYVSFIGDKASAAGFIFKPELEANTVEFYDQFVSDLNNVYGKGISSKTFKSPYEYGDGEEITAIETGNADFKTFWGMNDDKKPGGILLTISDKLLVSLTYMDKELMKMEKKKIDNKNQADL